MHDLLLSLQLDRIEAFTTKGSLLHGGSFVPFSSGTIGKDAITYHPGSFAGKDTAWLDNLPKASRLLGVPVLS